MAIDIGWLAVILMASVLINVGLVIYFKYTKLEEIEDLLYDVEFISWWKRVGGSSFKGRAMRLNIISMVVMMPGLLQKRGQLSRDAYMRLPTRLKNQVRALYFLLCANGAGMAAFYFYVQ